MGLPMGHALVASDLATRGFDIRSDDEFPGLDMEFDPDQAARGMTHMFSVVRDQAQTDALLFDDQALVRRSSDLRQLIICSTLAPPYILDLRERLPAHIDLVDAPMSGAQVAAEECRLTFMYGCDDEIADEIALLLAPMGQQLHHMGGLGRGMLTKVLNNFVAASSTVSTRLVLDWAAKWQLDQKRLLNTMHDSSGQTWFGTNFEAIEFARDGFEPDNSMGLLAKDIACALSCAPGQSDELGEMLIDYVRRLQKLDDR